MEVSFNAIRGSLDVVPAQKQPGSQGPGAPSSSCFLVFDGVGLTEDGLKDWLRLCAQQVNMFLLMVSCLMAVRGCFDVLTCACPGGGAPGSATSRRSPRRRLRAEEGPPSQYPSPRLPQTSTRDAAVVSLTWVSCADVEDLV